jgi:hypothetical protein
VTKIAVYKNQLPTPYNITYSGTMCCVHNGIVSEDELNDYKKTQIPVIIERMTALLGEDGGNVNVSDVTFKEEGEVDMTPVEA